MSAGKDKGTKWESAIVDYLVARGWVQAERRALNGTSDRGDITGLPGVVIEAKNQNRHSLAEWLDEATTEASNAGAAVGVVWHHRVGHASPAEGYVTMNGQTFATLLTMAGW